MANRLTKGTGLFGALRSNGALRTSGRLSEKRAANTVTDGASMVISAAQFYTDGVVSATPTAARDIQAPTAATVIALAEGYAVGDSFEFTLVNLAAATHALTLTANTGLTIIGSAAVAAASSGTWLVRIASSTTVVCYRK
jgi:hypothetical protein